MSTGPGRRLLVVSAFAVINIVGIVWIGHALMHSRAKVDVLSATVLSSRLMPDRLEVVFDQPMVPPDRVLQTEQAELFTISPPLPGVWRWSNRDAAEFLPEQRFPPGRILRLEPTLQIRRSTGKSLKTRTPLTVETQRLKLEQWTVRPADANEGRIRLVFNQPVDPKAFMACAGFHDVETKTPLAPLRCLTDRPGREIEVIIPCRPLQQFSVAITENLTGHGAELGLGEPVTIETAMPEGFALLHAHAGQPDLDGTADVVLEFTRELDLRQELPSVKTVPAVDGLQAQRRWRSLVLTGRFKPGARYEITIPATVLSKDGPTLGREVSAAVEIPEHEPRLALTHHSGILSPFGNLTLDARAVNVDGVELNAWRVHANNLVQHLQGGDIESTSRQTASKTIDVNMPSNVPTDLLLNLKGLLTQKTGIYRVRATPLNNRWAGSRAIVSITDLAITVKAESQGAMVWVTSLRTGKPVSKARVRAMSYNNQVLARAETDAQGIARLQLAGAHPDGGMWVITAEKGSDLSYLLPQDNQWVLDEMEQTGRPFCGNYEAMLYTERGVYRPGDTVYMTGILRDRAGVIPPVFPLTVQVNRPDGRQIEERLIQRKDGDQGVFHAQFETREDAQTGPYTLTARIPGSSHSIGAIKALVEAFVPVRMEVQAKAQSERFGPGQTPAVHVEARYLWDEPASGLPVSVEGILAPVIFSSREYAEYCFGQLDTDPPITLDPTRCELDPNGRTDMQVMLPETVKPGLYRLMLSATVTEPGGRSVSRNLSVVVDRLDRHIGIKTPVGRVARAQETTAVDWILVNGAGAVVEANELTMSLARLTYEASMQRVNDQWVWKSIETAVPVITGKPVGQGTSQGRFDITCPESGTYRLTLTETESGSCSRMRLTCSNRYGDSPEVAMDRPETLTIVADKDTYHPGEQARVVVKSPIRGTMLLTAETDQVLQTFLTDVNDGAADVNVPITEAMRGSVFLTASVIRPVDPADKTWQPHRAMGGLQLQIDHSSRRTGVQIHAPGQARPGEKAVVVVDTGALDDPNRPRLVHVWAVDEGILMASAHKTPDPYTFFLGPRRLGVSTSDVFYRLLPDHLRPAGIARIGADGFDLDSLRRNPVPTRQRKAAVVWREMVATDAQGQARFEMEWPDLIGQMRLMAVVVDRDAYGRADKPITLRAPLMIEASWPRCIAPDDVFQVPVKLFNTTEGNLSVDLTVDVNGPVVLEGPNPPAMIELTPGVPCSRVLKLRATQTGPAQVHITGRGRPDTGEAVEARHTGQFSVRPAAALHSTVELKSIPAGQRLELTAPDTMIPGIARMTVSVGSGPNVQLAPALEKLIGYPHGCVEQTSSRLLALLYASAILDDSRRQMLDTRVRRGITRLESMQTHSGGLSCWPGAPDAYLWGTAYAAGCLLEADIAGYEIDKRFLKALMQYLKPKLSLIGEDAPDLDTKALICRVLATFGDPAHGWMARLAEQADRLDIAGRAHLAGAYAAVGELSRGLSLLPSQPSGATVSTSTAGRLTSQVHQDAVWLSVLLDIDPNSPMATHLAGELDKRRKDGEWGSTLNNASAIAALAKYQARMIPQTPPQFEGAMVADTGQPVTFDHTQPVTRAFERVGKPITVSSVGTGTVYLTLVAEGLMKPGTVRPYNQGLFVTRRWVDAKGLPMDPNAITVGDLVQVEVTLRTTGQTVGNIAAVDILPGGLEVENPRLDTSSSAARRSGDQADHVEFLDDRVVLFCGAAGRERCFRYSLRAVTAGVFDLAPIQASCMYDPAIASMGSGGRVVIRNR